MNIILNGEPYELASGTTVSQLVERLGLAGKRLAIEIDREIVPRSAYGKICFRGGERVEIVHAIGGG